MIKKLNSFLIEKSITIFTIEGIDCLTNRSIPYILHSNMTDDSVSSLEGSEEKFSLAAPEEEGYVKTAAYNYSKSKVIQISFSTRPQ